MQTIKKYFSEAIKENSLLDRAYLFLEDGDTKNALAYFEKALDQNARSPFAYLGKMLVNLGLGDISEIELCENSYSDDASFQKALRFTEGELHDALARVSEARDTYAQAYEDACKAESKATDVEEFLEVYRLYEMADSFADAQAKMKTIKEALSVLAHYSAQGFSRVVQKVEGARFYQAELNAQLARFNTLISSEQKMLPVMKEEIAKRELELGKLGLFKKKRKLELMREIEEGKKALSELEASIKSNKKKRASVSSELARNGEDVALASIFDIKESGEVVQKAEGVGCPALEGVDLIVFENEEDAVRHLKKNGVIGIVAKNALALYEMMQNEKIVKFITESKKNANAVGTSPAFRKIASLIVPVIKQCRELQVHLPVALRLAFEASAGDTVTFGYFTKDGKDPYRDIIPLPGTPYVRPGKPVEWFVLKREGNLLTLIPQKPLLFRPFENYGRKEMTWKNSDMRAYMQGEMFDLLFQGEEKEIVVPMQMNMSGETSIDKIILPSYDEVLSIYSRLPPDDRHIWTRDYIEKTYYESSWLIQVSVFSLKYKEKWKLLVHSGAGLLPVVTVKIPQI